MVTTIEKRTRGSRSPASSRSSYEARGLLDIYLEESAAFRLLEPEEQHALLVKVIAARDAWLLSFLETEGALKAVWADLAVWKQGGMAGLSLIPGAPKGEGRGPSVDEYLGRLFDVFDRHVATHPRRPFRAGARSHNQLLARAVAFLGFRPGPLDRFRDAALEEATPAQARRIAARYEHFLKERRPLVEHNLRLVMRVARNFMDGPMALADLVQEGNLGLIRATESFSLRFGVRFSTYAYLWIRQSIIRALEDKSRTIRLPVSLTQKLRRLSSQQALEEASGMEGESKAAQELATLLVNPSVSGPVRSLQEGPEDSDPLGDAIADRRAVLPDRVVTQEDLRDVVRGSLVDLPDRQRLVLRLRFGIDCAQPHSLSEIGRLLGLSAERVRQIQEQAFDNLRGGPEGASLKDLILD